MAPLKVFVTGATGYIGGDVFYNVHQAHPDWEYAVLVRSKEKAEKLSSEYPKVRVVLGDLDSADIIEEEVKKADIVFHTADCDHVASAEAIAKGATHHTPERPLWWIHTSGTGILTVEDFRANTWGRYREKEHDDWDGVDELLNLPSDSLHRNVDEIVIAAGKRDPNSVKIAIVCPPTIYGPGRGPGNQKSVQAYWLASAVLKRKKGFLVNEGKNIWHQIHVQDLSDLYRLLGDAAAAGGGDATWNDRGYYLAENGTFVWGDISREVAKVAYEKKLISSPDVESISDDQVKELNQFGLYAWGSNSRGHSYRGRKLLGWSPHRPSLKELIPEIVDIEAKALGLL
ncbi:nucleoside-diphosphate-sugar epimerase [Aspergillus violaceofuscus CBS 115571]|uniref:Nucleoside-diphosphate-sugar epimerase n=1 Tax=Aspergillus violaceofuscus (strain CBS 115571) TaxID=1450538 RepID=A0A2V5HVK4_ASPV1|nr:nucleoside-diphosphate-sugar epimerase [Aspergillus violaceofuscus CBS 115571]